MAEVYATALAGAGLAVDDLGHLDLYSCFASSVHLALDALGLEPSDPRGVTVTGGLPFAGGAGSDYQTHAIATMVDTLRADPGSAGLVTGVGMHLTKHGAGVYSTEPGPVAPPDLTALQARLDAAHPPVAITDTASGPATVATYSVVHGRDGSAETGLAVVDLPDGTRAYARVEDAALLAEMEATEWVGAAVDLTTDGKRNTVRAMSASGPRFDSRGSRIRSQNGRWVRRRSSWRWRWWPARARRTTPPRPTRSRPGSRRRRSTIPKRSSGPRRPAATASR